VTGLFVDLCLKMFGPEQPILPGFYLTASGLAYPIRHDLDQFVPIRVEPAVFPDFRRGGRFGP
jgi:hypothetical protein